MSEDVASKV